MKSGTPKFSTSPSAHEAPLPAHRERGWGEGSRGEIALHPPVSVRGGWGTMGSIETAR